MTKNNKTPYLNFADMIILSLIFFGYATAASLYGYLGILQSGSAASDYATLTFSNSDNYQSIVIELVSLAVAWLYLHIRRFDLKVLNLSVNCYTLPLTLLLVVCAGLAADIYQYLHSIILPHHYNYPQTADAVAQNPGIEANFSMALLVFSLLNGFYEELFFLGLVYASPRKNLNYVLPFSLLIRFAFHTYQGLAGAATVTVLGVVYIFFRRKIKTLVPFMLAHSVFDIFGLGLSGLMWALWDA